MFRKLVSHNEDLRRLVEKGYAVGFDSNCLVIRDIPYLDASRLLKIGAIVAKLEFIDQERVAQTDHQIFFAGSMPHGLDGLPIPNLGGGAHRLALSQACTDVVVERSFSNKPRNTGRFTDFFEKIESYVAIISGPAIELHGASPHTFRVDEEVAKGSVFKFHDTLTSRAEIADLAAKFNEDVVAVIGLGGTGAYLLDFLVKTPVKEIRVFDRDRFYVHNAFRSPGRLSEAEFGAPKAEVYRSRYEHFREGLSVSCKHIDASCSEELNGVTFAFVCVDHGPSRAGIFDLLIARQIPFIDVGMGLRRRGLGLGGMLRTTYYSASGAQTVRTLGLAEEVERPDDLYDSNIQIAELNALNACLAVIRFKQLRGFYCEELPYYHLLFGIGDLKTGGEFELDEI